MLGKYIDMIFARKASEIEERLIEQQMKDNDITQEQLFETGEVKIDGRFVYGSDRGRYYG